LPAERDNARNIARCTQARKTTHDPDGQHQYMDKKLHIEKSVKMTEEMKKVRPWCGQPSDR